MELKFIELLITISYSVKAKYIYLMQLFVWTTYLCSSLQQ